MEQVFDEEKQACMDLFENSEDTINIQKISEQTFLHVDIVTKLHEEYLNL